MADQNTLPDPPQIPGGPEPLRDATPDVEEVQEKPFIPDFISEGTAKEIEMYGFAVDPRTGKRIDKTALPEGR